MKKHPCRTSATSLDVITAKWRHSASICIAKGPSKHVFFQVVFEETIKYSRHSPKPDDLRKMILQAERMCESRW